MEQAIFKPTPNSFSASFFFFSFFLKKPPYKFYILPLHERGPHPIALQNMNILATNDGEGRHILY